MPSNFSAVRTDHTQYFRLSKIFQICQPASLTDLALRLSLKDGCIVQYNVCRATITLSSPVFAQILHINSSHLLHSESPNFLYISGDDPEVLLVLLRAMHWQHHLVPDQIYDFDDLVKLAAIADKYNCVKVFETWRSAWLEPWWNLALRPGMEDWLLVSSVFGDRRNFENLTKCLIEESWATSNRGGVCTRSVTPGRYEAVRGRRYYSSFGTELIPYNILGEIRKSRYTLIRRLHFRAWALVKYFQSRMMPYLHGTTIGKESKAVEEMRLRLRSLGSFNPSAPYLPYKPPICDQRCMAITYGCLSRRAMALGVWKYIQMRPSDFDIDTIEHSPIAFYDALKSSIIAAESVRCKGTTCLACTASVLGAAALDRVMNVDAKGLSPEDFMKYRRHDPVGWETL